MPTQIPVQRKSCWTAAAIAALISSLVAAIVISAITFAIVWAYANLGYPICTH
jgi:hypothetical protein